MTGGSSLGLRSSSYGSLQQYHQQYQQQQQQQQQQMLLLQQKNVVAVQVVQSTPPLGGRKGSKMSLSGGSREKEKFLIWVCRLAGRRKVGMFLLAIISLVVLSSILSAPGKDDDMSVVPERNWLPSHPYSGTQIVRHNHKMNTSLEFEMRQVHSVNRIQDPLPIFNLSMFPATHPCEHFSLPPPPSDKKRTGPRPCDVCYLPVEHAMAFMPISQSESPVLKHLTYFSEENSHLNATNGGSSFGGHPSLQQRNDSFHIQDSMTVHCGFFKGTRPGIGSGFDIDGMDLFEMEQCQNVVVASAIFGNYDVIQQPKNISELTKKHACFFMFVDEETEAYMKNSSTLDSTKKVGLWRVVVVRNLPYADARRNGKIPKLLLHRLFPNARYSLWIDGKLELVVDPYQILERFLWRKNATFAISRHYRRFDVFLEAEANKAAGKYDNASIDYQIEFYKNEGLTPYSEAKLPITSDVPEGCVIIREHLPISNLFTCLWFNEVDRFTSRDQISFSTVRDKIMSKVNWSIDMFLDCERRNFVIQAYHRDLLEQMKRSPPLLPPPLPPVVNSRPARKSLPETVSNKASRSPPKKPPAKRGRDRKSGSRHHRPKVVNNDRNNNPI